MKFKILDIKSNAVNVQVGVQHKDSIREVFGLPLEFAEDNKYLEEIKKILKEREKTKTVKIDKTQIGKEFNY